MLEFPIINTSHESALSSHSHAIGESGGVLAYLALIIKDYFPSICCIAVFDTNVEKHSWNLIMKFNDRSNVCCILVVLFYFLLKQINKQIISFFIMYIINLHLIVSYGKIQVLLSNG